MSVVLVARARTVMWHIFLSLCFQSVDDSDSNVNEKTTGKKTDDVTATPNPKKRRLDDDGSDIVADVKRHKGGDSDESVRVSSSVDVSVVSKEKQVDVAVAEESNDVIILGSGKADDNTGTEGINFCNTPGKFN